MESNLKTVLKKEKHFKLSEQQRDRLQTEVEIKTHRGQILKKKNELVFGSLDEELTFRTSNYKKSLKEKTALTFFNSYRDILDMDSFEETQNTFIFFKDFIL